VKLFLTPGEPLQAPFDSELTADMAALRASRKKYSESLLEKLRAPDGSYEKGFVVPGSNAAPERSVRTSANLDTNNPLSLHNEVRPKATSIEEV
jgi:TBC1 domain family member 5